LRIFIEEKGSNCESLDKRRGVMGHTDQEMNGWRAECGKA